MSINPEIVLELIDSDTMATQQAELKAATNRSFTPVFNGPGSFSLSVPLWSDAARIVRKRKHGILFYRNGQPVWSGGITSVVKSAKAGTCAITATGWHEELEHRQVWKVNEHDLIFGGAGVAGGLIVKAIIEAINSQEDDDTSTARPVRLSFGEALDTQVRTGAYKEGDGAWAKIKELIEIEDGLDISMDWLGKVLSTRAPDAFTVRTGVQFGWGTDPHNLDDAVETDDGTTVGNRQSVKAANGAVYVADDGPTIDYSGVMLEDWTSLSDVQDPTIALAYANAQLVYKGLGTKTYSLTPKRYSDLPRPYDDFEWGDVGFLSIDRDGLQVSDQAIRLFSASITYDDNGNEIIGDLQVTASA